jgi:hypothetical protein
LTKHRGLPHHEPSNTSKEDKNGRAGACDDR